MTNFAARGGGMKMVNDVNFIAKKMKDIKFWGKYMLCTSKESWKHVEFIFRLKKYDISKKNQFFDFFWFFFLLVSER